MRKIAGLLAAAGMAAAPIAASAQDASLLSISRAAAPMVSGLSFLQDGEESNHGGGSTAVILGVVLIILIGAAAIGGSGSEPSNSP
jgi:hypothetical protein